MDYSQNPVHLKKIADNATVDWERVDDHDPFGDDWVLVAYSDKSFFRDTTLRVRERSQRDSNPQPPP